MASRSELRLHTGCFYESVSKMLRPEPCCRLSPSDPLKVDIILNNISTLSRRFWCHTRVENCQRFRSWWKGKGRAPNFCWQWGGFSSTCLCGCRKDDASIQLFGSFIRLERARINKEGESDQSRGQLRPSTSPGCPNISNFHIGSPFQKTGTTMILF